MSSDSVYNIHNSVLKNTTLQYSTISLMSTKIKLVDVIAGRKELRIVASSYGYTLHRLISNNIACTIQLCRET